MQPQPEQTGPYSLETVETSCGICHKIGPIPWKNDKVNHACIYVDYPGKSPYEEELLEKAGLIKDAWNIHAQTNQTPSGLLALLKDARRLNYDHRKHNFGVNRESFDEWNEEQSMLWDTIEALTLPKEGGPK